MRLPIVLLAATTLLPGSCIHSALQPVEVTKLSAPVSYEVDVQPVLDQRCAVCHSCYNAPCQLKLTSFEGTDRGDSKARVYSSSRLTGRAPTRMFVDAQTTEEWRAKGFHGVTENTAEGDYNDSIMLQLLAAKVGRPMARQDYHAEAGDLTCSANDRELGAFLGKHPDRGMPFGFPALRPQEYAILATWLQQGARGPGPEERAQRASPSPANAAEIEKWEGFLNHEDAKHAMTARYL